MSYHRCPKCASDQVVDGAFVSLPQGSRITVGVDHNPDGDTLAQPASTGLHASVCGSCGYVELWANRPGELLEAYRKAARTRPASPPGNGGRGS
ncbi:MAG: hypothetical protein ACE5GJ_02385 [Gemmatimonadota bacterium]